MTSGILQQLHFCSNKRFTGKLSIISLDGNSIDNLQGHCWNLHFYRGRLIGDSGGIHPVRRMRRQFSQQCIELPEAFEAKLLSSAETKDRNYFIIGELLANQHIDREQAEHIIVGSLIEVLFDIFQYEAIGKLADKSRLSCILENDKADGAIVPAVLLKSELIWDAALSDLRVWQEKGLMKYSPNLCPEINDFVKFQAATSARTYNKIVNLLDPDRTLRDIATKIDEDVSIVAFSLAKYQEKRVLSFRRIGDLSSAGKRLFTGIIGSTSSSVFKDKFTSIGTPRQLIVHLGDNDAEIRTIEAIVQKAGADYTNLRDPGQAMIALLRCNPELIIIDGAASFNANDFCVRLRRTSKFRDTPIVLLQDSENMMSWMRSRMMNYQEIITKPISHQKIFKLVDRYLSQLVS